MLKPLVSLLAWTTLALAMTGCAATTREGATTDTSGVRSSTFESWAVGNGTGSFFRPLGPAGGTGVRHAWPE
jgi:hypothetical protein